MATIRKRGIGNRCSIGKQQSALNCVTLSYFPSLFFFPFLGHAARIVGS